MDFGLFLLRLALGLTLAAHGSQKLFGAFSGPGLKGTAGFFAQLGFPPGPAFATLAGLGELGGGLLLVVGLLTPLGAAAIVATMLVAILTVHYEKGFFASNGGYELPMLILIASDALAFTGPGSFSLDAVLGLRLSGLGWGFIALALGILGALLPLSIRAQARRRQSSTPA